MATPTAQGHVRDADRVRTDPVFWKATLMPSTAVTCVVMGSFSGPGATEFVFVRHTTIELLVLTKKNQLELISSLPMFSTIRAAAAVPVAAVSADAAVDLLAITSDSGDIALLRFRGGGASTGDGRAAAAGAPILPAPPSQPAGTPGGAAASVGGSWVVESRLPFTKIGIRADTPGHYLTADASGRCVMVAAPLKQKLLFPIRQEHGALSFASPIEAHRLSVVFDVVPVDVGPGANPIFAVLEHPLEPGADSSPVSYGSPYSDDRHNAEASVKQVLYYEYDVGTNNALRTWTVQAPNSSHKLVAVPGGHAPGGVLICAKGEIWWVNPEARGGTRAVIPRRDTMPLAAGELVVVAAASVTTSKAYFILLQTQVGDLYRVEVAISARTQLPTLIVRYFETVPVARQLLLTRRGHVLLAAEHGPHQLYKTIHEGYKDESYITKVLQAPVVTAQQQGQQGQHAQGNGPSPPTPAAASVSAVMRNIPCFAVHTTLSRFALLSVLYNSGSMARVIPQLTRQGVMEFHALCGAGPQAAMLTTRGGHAAPVLLQYPLNAVCERIWYLAAGGAADQEPRIVVVMGDRTSVLVMPSDPKAKIVADTATQLRLDVATVLTCVLHEGAGVLQVHREGLRHIGHEKHVVDWRNDLRKEVLAAACNGRQLLVGFANGGIALFQLDLAVRKLAMVAEDRNVADVISVTVPPAPPGAASQVVEYCGAVFASNEFFVLHTRTLRKATKRPITSRSRISSVAMLFMGDDELYAFVGLSDGITIRAHIDRFSGDIKSQVPISCGTAPCRLVLGDAASRSCYIISDQLWRCTSTRLDGLVALPIICGSTTRAGPRNVALVTSQSDVAPVVSSEGGIQLAHLVGSSIFILGIDVTNNFFHERTRLRCTGRQCLRLGHGTHRELYVIGMCEKNGPVERQQPLSSTVFTPQDAAMHTSYLQLYNPATRTLGKLIDLPPGDAILCMAAVRFTQFGSDPVVVVGVAAQYHSSPPSSRSGSLLVYRVHRAPEPAPGVPPPPFPVELSLLHVTLLRTMPTALCEFRGGVLVGMDGPTGLHLLRWGHKHLLRQMTLPHLPSRITSLSALEDTILCGTADQGVLLVRFHRFGTGADGRPPVPHLRGCLFVAARDPIPRFTTATCLIDPRTFAVADRFGNLSILRVPSTLPLDLSDNLFTDAMLDARANQALACVASIFIGEAVTSLSMTIGNPVPESTPEPGDGAGDAPPKPAPGGGAEVATRLLVYSTVMGTVGCLQPFASDEDAIAACRIQETLLGQQLRSPSGRLVSQYYSTYTPHRNVIDADLLALLDRPEASAMITLEQVKQVHALVDEELNGRLRKQAKVLLRDELRRFPTASQLMQKMRKMVLLL